MKSRPFLTVVLAILTAALLLTAAIAAPILCRPFYYAHISPLRLEEQTGLTWAEIRTAFDEMMDFCLGGDTFSTGVLPWSEAGRSHFEDVRALFLLDLHLLAGCAGALAVLLVVMGARGLRPARLLGHGPAFWAGAGMGSAFLLVGGLAALDFNRAFVLFHTLFFPGKNNWIFYPDQDAIILILPQVFFQNCALLILALAAAGCVGLIAWDVRTARQSPPSPDTPQAT